MAIVPLLACGSLLSAPDDFWGDFLFNLAGFAKCIVPIMIIPLLLFFIKLDLPSITNKLRVQSDFRKYKYLGEQKQLLSFNADGITFEDDTSERFFKWDMFDSVIENEDLFLLIYENDLYKLIPKRAFPDPQSAQLFYSELERQYTDIRIC